jgi:glycosyltransferase involved in cell wall biosynthesis
VRVLAAPAFANRRANPYNALLYEALVVRGVEVGELDLTTAVAAPADVVHLHWPESPLNKRRRRAAAYRSVQLLVVLTRLRRRGVRIVWTAHNVQSHFRRYPRAERLWWRAFVRLLDGWLSLSRAGADAAVQAHPRLALLPSSVIPHGDYRAAYPDIDRVAARAALGIADSQRVVLFVGRVKPYKGVPELCRAFAEWRDPAARLIVAGRCDEPELAAELRALAGSDGRITLRLEEIPDSELSRLLRAADLVVLPFRAVLNSGSALLALSFDAPVLCPPTGALGELADLVPGWVTTYERELTAADIEAALLRPRPHGRPDLTNFAWDRIAEQTEAFYRRVLAHDGAR